MGWLAFLSSLVLPTGATSGARIVLDGGADRIVIYDAGGNVVLVLAATAGTVSGQPYDPDLTIIGGNGGQVSFRTGNSFEVAAAELVTAIQGAGTAQQGVLDLKTADFGNGTADLFLVSTSHDGTVTASMQFNIGGGLVAEVIGPGTGFLGGLFQPFGTLLQAAPPDGSAGVAAWTSITLQNGWTQRAGSMKAQYHFVPFSQTGAGGYGATWLKGVIVPGTKTDGTTVFTLPAAYCNQIEAWQIPLATTGISAANDNHPFLQVNTDGTCTVNGINFAGLTNILFNGFLGLGAPS
jgi:hypothetical protein